MRRWLLRWLGGVPTAEFDAFRAAHEDLVRQVGLQHSEQQKAFVELATEFNALRNNLPAVLTAPAKPPVRVFRNFREFRSAIEGHQPIPIERTS